MASSLIICFRRAIVSTMAFLLLVGFLSLPLVGFLSLPLVGFLSLPLVGTAHADTKPEVYLSLADKNNAPLKEPQTLFDCTDKIYTVVELDGFDKGSHHFSVEWKDPGQTVRERTEYPFSVVQKDTRLWSWLSLSRATGAGMLQWLNPAAGLEEFIGLWQVEVRIDDKVISTEKFEVSC